MNLLPSFPFHTKGDAKEVVESPTDISFSRAGMRPPRILPGSIWVEMTKGVNIPRFNDPVKPLAFVGQEACLARVGLRARQIDLFVRGIDVTTEDYSPSSQAKFSALSEEGVAESQLVRQTRSVTAAIWEIGVDQGEVTVVSDNRASFSIELVATEPILYSDRLLTRQYRSAAVAWLHGAVPEGMIAVRFCQIVAQLLPCCSGFLQAEDIRGGTG